MDKIKATSCLLKTQKEISALKPTDLERGLVRETLLRASAKSVQILAHLYALPCPTPSFPLNQFIFDSIYAKSILDPTLFPLSPKGLFLPLNQTPETPDFDSVLIDINDALAHPSSYAKLKSHLHGQHKKIILTNITSALATLVDFNKLTADAYQLTWPLTQDVQFFKGKEIWIKNIQTSDDYKNAAQKGFDIVSGPFVESLLSSARHKKCPFKKECAPASCQSVSTHPTHTLKCANPSLLLTSLKGNS